MDHITAHKYCTANKTMLENDERCGCFHCCNIFSPREITEWSVDNRDETAICPYCGIDAVIGESAGYLLTKEALEKMHKHWF